MMFGKTLDLKKLNMFPPVKDKIKICSCFLNTFYITTGFTRLKHTKPKQDMTVSCV